MRWSSACATASVAELSHVCVEVRHSLLGLPTSLSISTTPELPIVGAAVRRMCAHSRGSRKCRTEKTAGRSESVSTSMGAASPGSSPPSRCLKPTRTPG